MLTSAMNGPRTIAGVLLPVICLLWHAVAIADPTIAVPPVGKGTLISAERQGEPASLALVGQVDILAVLGAEPATEYPDIGDIEGGVPQLSLARIGLVGFRHPLAYSLRVDASEGLRISLSDLEEKPMATIDRFIDDAAIWWLARDWARLVVGRFKVPFSRFRQLERTTLTAGVAPFVVDRTAPDRRWGTSVYGDLGGIAYAVGAYADLDALEPRIEPIDEFDCSEIGDQVRPDPSSCGRFMVTGYAWWTPRAPIGPDHIATPSSDPWFDIMRPAAGLGVLWRERHGGNRLDISLAGQIAYRRWAAVGELFGYLDGDAIGVSVAVQGSVLVTRRLVLFANGEYDDEQARWSAGGGASIFATRDRRNKVSISGFVRREQNNGPKRDGVVVLLQAAL